MVVEANPAPPEDAIFAEGVVRFEADDAVRGEVLLVLHFRLRELAQPLDEALTQSVDVFLLNIHA